MSDVTLTLAEALEQAIASYQAGQLAKTAALCRAIVDVSPDHFQANHLLGVVQTGLGNWQEGLASYDRALAVNPDSAQVLSNRGAVLRLLNRFDEALASYEKALAIQPHHIGALSNRGATLLDSKRYQEALASYEAVLRINPDFAEALCNRGVALHALQRFDDALASFDRALTIKPDEGGVLRKRAVTLHELGRFEEALASTEQALAIEPESAEALNNRGMTLKALYRLDEALASYDRALAIRRDSAETLNNRGITLMQLNRAAEALASYDAALAIKADFAEALSNRGRALEKLNRFDEALASYEKAASGGLPTLYAFSGLLSRALNLCDWTRTKKLAADVAEGAFRDGPIVSPFAVLGYSDEPSLQLEYTRKFAAKMIPMPPCPMWHRTIYRHERIRVAYLSADFRQHAMAHLETELFERHNRSRFEVIGISFGEDDRSEIRSRIVGAFDRFHDVRLKDDRTVAELLYALEVDIAVDLMGHTRGSRAGILAHRPAPIQVNYLGYPATMGTDFIDYVIADPIVLPMDQQPFYTEKIVHLPDSYQANDTKRKITVATPTRGDMGLPENALVFCCFNSNYKITPAVFDIWMRLLGAIEGSVLWLLRSNRGAIANLRKEAARRGVDPARLVFAPHVQAEQHLARHRLADFFLDTLPYNAHTTASDALWLGLPLITCTGKSFAGRVASSLLAAVGLPELVTGTLDEYEALALKLATDPLLLESFRRRLQQNRLTYPLFDTDRFRRHIEIAYTTMWQLYQHGETPRSFGVEPV